MIWLRKVLRELRAQLGQTLAVLVVIALGVMLFVASAGAYEDLSQSYADTQTRLAQADLQIDVTQASASDLAGVRKLPGVASADSRVEAMLPVLLHRGADDERVALRVLSLPASDAPGPRGSQPRLDQVLIVSGHLPEKADEVLLEKHLAQHFGLTTGDTVRLDVGGVSRGLHVSGVGVSAEYLWVARSAHDIFPSPDEFGVGWMQRYVLQDVARAIAGASPEIARATDGLTVAAGDDANQVLVARRPGTDLERVVASLRGTLGERFLAATPKEQLVGLRLLQMDVDGYRGMAGFFLFFLGVGAFIVAAVLARLVDGQRAVLGTLMALGVSRGSVMLQVLGHAGALGAVGSAAGALAGLGLSPELTRAYAEDLGIPFVTARLHVGLALAGAGIGIVVAVAAGLVPALHASSLAPAEAMRPPKPRVGRLTRVARRVPAPLAVRLALRNVLGRPLRSLSTALGVAAALVLVLVTGSMLDSMRTTFSVLFDLSRRYDFRVELLAPEPEVDVGARFTAIAGVAQIEQLVDLPVTIAANGRSSADVLLQGLPDGARLARSVDLDGRLVAPRANEVVVTRTVATKLGVAIGDAVDVRIPGAGDASFRVGGYADGAMGPTVSARLADVQRAFGLGDRVTAVAVASRGEPGPLRAAFARMGDVAHLEDVRAIRDQVGTLMGLGWAMLGAMLFFGAILAAAILFNTATLGILERSRELATLRTLGRSQGEIAAGITLEHALLAALGLAVGYPLATWTSRQVLALYSNDLFQLPYVMRPETIAFAIGGIVAVLFVAQWPALRHLARTSLAEAVRSRE